MRAHYAPAVVERHNGMIEDAIAELFGEPWAFPYVGSLADLDGRMIVLGEFDQVNVNLTRTLSDG